MSQDLDDDDPELADYVRIARRADGVWFALVGAIIIGCSVVAYAIGASMKAAQADLPVKLTLPSQLQIGGSIAAAVGALLLVIGVKRLRGTRAPKLPVATARRR